MNESTLIVDVDLFLSWRLQLSRRCSQRRRFSAVGVVFVVFFSAAIPLRQNDDEKNGPKATDPTPEPKDPAKDGLHLLPVAFVDRGGFFRLNSGSRCDGLVVSFAEEFVLGGADLDQD